MIVTCLFFAESRELAETRDHRFELPDRVEPQGVPEAEIGELTVRHFRERYLLAQFPALAILPAGFLFALNQQHLSPQQERSTLLRHLDELAIIPPLSGG
jgi:molybdopterin converting factor small subunit